LSTPYLFRIGALGSFHSRKLVDRALALQWIAECINFLVGRLRP
jgi:hypothetical protein